MTGDDHGDDEGASGAGRVPLPPVAAPFAPRAVAPTPTAVPGYRPPAGGVWTPPCAQEAAAAPPPAPPLHTLTAAGAESPGWGWKQAFWGLLLGMGPFLLLYGATYSLPEDVDTTIGEVTVATGLVFLVSSAIGYGWDYFAAWLFSGRGAANKWRAWGFRLPTLAFFWTIPVALVGAYLVSYVNDLALHPEQQDIVEAFPPTAGGIVLFALVAVVMAPLAEELYFRGFLFKGFANSWGWVWGAVVSGVFFSLAHLQLTLFFPLFGLGFALAWVYQRTGSLWTSIALHAVFNGISVLAWALTS